MKGKQNQKNLKLPQVKKSHKYNQQKPLKSQRQFRLLSRRKQLALLHSNYLPQNSFQQSKQKIQKYLNSYMSTMKKIAKQKQPQDCKKNVQIEQPKPKQNYVNNKLVTLSQKTINTKQKPPHRYKTTMLIYKHCLLLYGGLGCEKNLTWAKLSFETMNWQFAKTTFAIKPIDMYFPCSPIYGHTMVKYKDMAIIFGGSCIDQINQTTIIHTKTMNITQGSRCPFRRRQHAAVVVNNYMLIHGGIEAKQVKSQILIYNIPLDKWTSISNCGLPALSSHKICKGKSNKQAYIFGGLNSKGKSTNKLYRIRGLALENNEIKWELIESENNPSPRHSFCFQKVTNNILLLFGGRDDSQACSQDQGLQHGVFNDVHTYNIDRKVWQRVLMHAGFQHAFGMASTSTDGAVFIYGGSSYSTYADASIHVIWNSNQRNDPWQSIQTSEMQICSSKKISANLIRL